RVLGRRCRIEGVRCTAVRDLTYVAGRLEERTTDFFAQDDRGRVWYFGEETAELDAHGKVTSTEGTWRSGVHGARAGIVMPAPPPCACSPGPTTTPCCSTSVCPTSTASRRAAPSAPPARRCRCWS